MQNYCLLSSKLNVEQTLNGPTKFNFSIDDPQAKWSNSTLFELNNIVEIKMGYSTTLETVAIGQITETKTVFPPNRSPFIEISGENKALDNAISLVLDPNVYLLAYGNTLLSLSATVKFETQNPQTRINSREPSRNKQNLHCTGECIGLPDIKPGAAITLSRLGKKYNQIYMVEKAIHLWEENLFFKTKFEARH